MHWFDVDKAGLAKILARRGIEFIAFELVQNAWDENTSRVDLNLERIPNTRRARLTVEDDSPDGFANLSHAFTLFAESAKKGDAERRGRFNLGEKLVLAMADEAEICSTKGTIRFDAEGRKSLRRRRERGTVFQADIRMTGDEIAHCLTEARRLIPPPGIETYVGGVRLPIRTPKAVFQATLPTELADEEGRLRPTRRKASVELHEPATGETPCLYEMGIPVVELPGGDRFHINVQQKLPIAFDRDNVPPAYLSRLRALVVENVAQELTAEDAVAPWVRDALQNNADLVGDETVRLLMDRRFGEKRVAYDPTDPEANKLAVSKGYTVVHGGNLSGMEWAAVRRAGAMLPAGKVTPSPKPFSPDGAPLRMLDREEWSPAVAEIVAYTKAIAPHVLGCEIAVEVANNPKWPFAAVFGNRRLIFNYGRLRERYFEADAETVNDLVIHEFGHHWSGDHLSAEYYSGLTRAAGRIAALALSNPALFPEQWRQAPEPEAPAPGAGP